MFKFNIGDEVVDYHGFTGVIEFRKFSKVWERNAYEIRMSITPNGRLWECSEDGLILKSEWMTQNAINNETFEEAKHRLREELIEHLRERDKTIEGYVFLNGGGI